MLFGDEMIDGMHGPGHRLGDQAIFAARIGLFSDQPAQTRWECVSSSSRLTAEPGVQLTGLGKSNKVLDVLKLLPFSHFIAYKLVLLFFSSNSSILISHFRKIGKSFPACS